MRPEPIFVDTSAWVALADRDDGYHTDAASVYPYLLATCGKLLTSNLVIAESYVLIMRSLGRDAAIAFLDKINGSPRIARVSSTFDVEREAEEILKKYRDQNFSYTDAVSFAIMRRRKIKKSFSFDKHFRTMGFITLPS